MKITQNNKLVKIGEIKPNTYNPKLNFRENEDNGNEFEKIKNSIEKFGQVQPIIVRQLEDDSYEIINGYHRFEAMKELGYEDIEIKDLGKIDFDTAIAIALQTEDTKVPIDSIELAQLMKNLTTPEKPIEYWANLFPYSAELIKSKIDLIHFDFSQFEDKNNEPDLKTLSYVFSFKDEVDLAKVGDYFNQFPKEERGAELAKLIG
jgi:ParB-like chromosome segregation protein Spo0J